MSLFQSNLRKQLRKLPKILKSVKIIQYYSILFIRVLIRDHLSPLLRPPQDRGAVASFEEVDRALGSLPAVAARLDEGYLLILLGQGFGVIFRNIPLPTCAPSKCSIPNVQCKFADFVQFYNHYLFIVSRCINVCYFKRILSKKTETLM